MCGILKHQGGANQEQGGLVQEKEQDHSTGVCSPLFLPGIALLWFSQVVCGGTIPSVVKDVIGSPKPRGFVATPPVPLPTDHPRRGAQQSTVCLESHGRAGGRGKWCCSPSPAAQDDGQGTCAPAVFRAFPSISPFWNLKMSQTGTPS